jgi:hypothetical protein
MEFSSKKQHIQKESNQFRAILKSAFWQIFLSGETILALPMSQAYPKEIMIEFTIPNDEPPPYANVCFVNQLQGSDMIVSLGYADPVQVSAALESSNDLEDEVTIAVKPSLRFVIGAALARKLISQLQENLS